MTLEIQERNHNLQKEHNEKVFELTRKIDNGESQIEKMRRDHEFKLKEQKQRHETERQ